MAAFNVLIRFESTSDSKIYFADLGLTTKDVPEQGSQVDGYETVESLLARKGGKQVSVGKVLAPVPRTEIPIYCVGLNYTTHAAEAKLSVPKNPPLWTKPAAALANPGEDIKINKFCASSLLDYEGELVFVTSRECRDITPEEASSYILGYTVGNDLSCRIFQLPDQAGGQFFFAKAFDKFAPIGPVLVSPEAFDKGEGLKLITRLNGEVMQDGDIAADMIWKPAKILSWMSQGTTIPAGTVVMTGTPAGVGVFKDPRRFLKDGDVVEVEIPAFGTLRNKIVFEQ